MFTCIPECDPASGGGGRVELGLNDDDDDVQLNVPASDVGLTY